MIGEPPGQSGSAFHLDAPTAVMSPVFTRGSVGGSVGSPRDGDVSPFLTPLRRYLPSNEFGGAESDSPPTSGGEWPNVPADVYSSDEFRMFEFKIQRCSRGKSHDWTECPFAHPGEKARRRDPRKYHYSGTACPEFRKGGCVKGDLCEFSHGVFECWLHPSRYRTQACKDGTCCSRRVCFFAHTPEQLRAVPPQSPRSGLEPYDCSSIRHAFDPFAASPTSTLASPASESPPLSPGSYPLCVATGRGSLGELVASIRKLQIGRESGGKLCCSPIWGVSGYGSPRRSVLRHASASPTVSPFPYPCGQSELWEDACTGEEAAAGMVESGRMLRAAILEKLGKEKSSDVGDAAPCPGPDVGWVSELVNTG